MNKRSDIVIAEDPDDIGFNDSKNEEFSSILNKRVSRRGILRGGLASAAGAFLGSVGLSACGGNSGGDDVAAAPFNPAPTVPTETVLGFTAVAKSMADQVMVPAGYTASVLYALGDPINAGTSAYKNDGTDANFESRAGDHHDGMSYFGLGAGGKWSPNESDKGLLVMNHEAITPYFLHQNGVTIDGTAYTEYPGGRNPPNVTGSVNMKRTVEGEVIKEMNAHGVSVIEVNRNGTSVSVNKNSTFNRRITTLTRMEISGPAAGAMMATKYSPAGTHTRGTVNNCANGTTPWGTYLTCEENWAGYFRRLSGDDSLRTPEEVASFKRYGVGGNGRELWATVTAANPADQDIFDRWNAGITSTGPTEDYRNVANTYGWVVEINPFDPTSTPKKRTALGRFGHENVAFLPPDVGQPLVCYMGDDSKGEYLYKYVSTRKWEAADAENPAAGDLYLDHGKLYVAKFNDDGSGTWIELSFNSVVGLGTYAFASDADVLINARLAADAVGATKMDRPEWVAVNPATGDAYLTLTNNASNKTPPQALSDQRSIDKVDAANPRAYTAKGNNGNINGHIVRWKDVPDNVTSFRWDVFLFGARAEYDKTNINVSNLTADNDFSSPDGAWFGGNGILWIQTDDGAYTDVTNCMMLAAVPGKTGDGGKRTITNTVGATTRSVDTYVGKELGDANLRRFLVGPKECEITGIAETPDGRTMFVNIQHPGENTKPNFADPASFGSHWPGGGNTRPRSATIVITKNDGGRIGT